MAFPAIRGIYYGALWRYDSTHKGGLPMETVEEVGVSGPRSTLVGSACAQMSNFYSGYKFIFASLTTSKCARQIVLEVHQPPRYPREIAPVRDHRNEVAEPQTHAKRVKGERQNAREKFPAMRVSLKAWNVLSINLEI